MALTAATTENHKITNQRPAQATNQPSKRQHLVNNSEQLCNQMANNQQELPVVNQQPSVSHQPSNVQRQAPAASRQQPNSERLNYVNVTLHYP